ncbi:glycine-rich domain-containing protein [Phascolarctobacterium succinatutens]
MASGLTPYYLLQPAFTGGEISAEVANRVDLDKYQLAVLQAYNCLIKPHGPIYRRPGMKYMARTKYSDKACILVPFNGADSTDYLLEIGEKYIRVHKNGLYINIEVMTPYTADMLQDLRFVQSADTMFIASGKYPVKQLARYSDIDWRFADFEITDMYFDESTTLENYSGISYTVPGTYQFQPTVTGEYQIDIAGAGGGGGGGVRYSKPREHGHTYYCVGGGTGGSGERIINTLTLTKGTSYTIIVGSGGAGGGGTGSYGTASNGGNGGNSTACGLTGRGGTGGSGGSRVSIGGSYENTRGVQGTTYGAGGGGIGGVAGTKYNDNAGKAGADGWAKILYTGNKELTPSGTTGDITLTSNKNIFAGSKAGAYIKLKQEIASKTVSTSNGTTERVRVGENWKVISHGTWSGSFTIEKSDDGESWKEYRKYTSGNDYNPSESGSVTEPVFLRAVCTITSGTCTVDLTAMAYNAEGVVKLTEITSDSTAKAHVEKELGSTDMTTNFLWGAWSEEFGYPQTLCFFQDRLCFGGTKKQPYMVWMSRTGDYGNFSVEKASGTVTDDSAVALAFVSRKQFKILHLIASTDLIVLTAGNEWTVSGSDTVTPSKAVPKMQTTRGCSTVEPLMIGGRIVFVQGRGSTVRDMAYSYETDSYGGNDLTLLAKHIIENVQIVDSAYKQEPDSTIYFVRSDGSMACLSYIMEQKVYAWSTIETQGKIEAVAAVQEGDEDIIYLVVQREINGVTVRNIEYLAKNPAKSNNPDDYIMLDNAIEYSTAEKSSGETEIDAAELAGEKVTVIGDGRMYSGLTVSQDGTVTLPAAVQHAFIGLPYRSIVELPNVEIKTGDGTMQGRKKQISNCILRLSNSLGGMVGPDINTMDLMNFDEQNAVSDIKLFTGDKHMTLPIGGFNNEGRVIIVTDEPYPFNLLAVVREVSFGG